MSTFGTIFRVTTFGESHCKGVGAIIDGVPPGLELTEADIQPQLTRRRPGQSTLTTPRNEADKVTILSGTEFGRTLGTPIGLFVPNEDQRPGDYKEMSSVPRPGHADYTYQMKYGIRASSGGGRSSARETIGRVAAGAIAEKWLLQTFGTRVVTWVNSVGHISIPEEVVAEKGCGWTREEVDRLGALNLLRDPSVFPIDLAALEKGADAAKRTAELERKDQAETAFLAAPEEDATPAYRDASGAVYTRTGAHIPAPPANIDAWVTDDLVALRCPHPPTSCKMATLIREVKAAKDSIGGTLTTMCTNVPPCLGEPVFDRLEAKLAHAMLSLPATKGFEIGTGFRGTAMRGSAHNDAFVANTEPGQGKLTTKTNNAGGTLGGISVGTPIQFRVAIKAVSTIGQAQHTSTFDGTETVLEAKGRHDPCVLPRAPPLLEGMTTIVLADAVMMQRTRLGGSNLIADPSLILAAAETAEANGHSAKKARAE
ncbi:chorismate synthase [Pavlovales sp. CCMP2436]|nr:chorismate synthase [Pavlovales sp. CCMP2436]|mmetsp:Transcript_5002/g.12957  ORF Transcript_5002/g.12957 Transcript_5002/m.12957 type:complete len:484 (-) Transcript_5002:398-1849(-)